MFKRTYPPVPLSTTALAIITTCLFWASVIQTCPSWSSELEQRAPSSPPFQPSGVGGAVGPFGNQQPSLYVTVTRGVEG